MSIGKIIETLETANREYKRMIDARTLCLCDESVYGELRDCIDLFNEIIALLRTHPDAQPNEPQGDGWISVEDKDNPPPEAKKVIVWLKLRGGDICDMAYYTGEDGWYYEGWDAPHHGVVTHWRPLPDPPKEA